MLYIGLEIRTQKRVKNKKCYWCEIVQMLNRLEQFLNCVFVDASFAAKWAMSQGRRWRFFCYIYRLQLYLVDKNIASKFRSHCITIYYSTHDILKKRKTHHILSRRVDSCQLRNFNSMMSLLFKLSHIIFKSALLTGVLRFYNNINSSVGEV